MAKAVKVLLADDHALVRSGMKALLIQQEGIEVVGEAADGQAALLAVEQLRPDVLLLDISLPGLNGLELLSRLKTHAPLTAVVVLSMHDAEEYVLRAYQEGALSYLTKDAPAEHLVAAVRAAGRKETFFPPGIDPQRLANYLQNSGALPARRLDRLTSREREVLQLLAEGYSTQAAALKIGVSPKTVESHRAKISSKLGLYDIASLTRFAVYCGLVDARQAGIDPFIPPTSGIS